MKPRVVFLGGGDRSLCLTLVAWLRLQDCQLVVANSTERPVWDDLPEYDLGLNFLGTHKVPPEHVHRPRLGWTNFHPGPLPEFGGRNLAYNAIMQGSGHFGSSVHYMDEGYDTGPLIDVVRFPIEPHYNARDVFDLAIKSLRSQFIHWVPLLLQSRVPSTPQPKGSVRIYPKTDIDNELRLTEEEQRQVRAVTFTPDHYARTCVNGRWYKLVPE